MNIHIQETGALISGDNLQDVVIYGNGEIIFRRGDCTLQESVMKDGRITEVYDGKITTLHLFHPVKIARKENLNRKDNYFISTRDNILHERRLILYIHISEVNVEDLGDMVALKNEDETCYLKTAKLTFKAGATFTRMKIERLPYDPDFAPQDGGIFSSCYGTKERPCYEVFDNSSRFSRNKDFPEKIILKKWTERETQENCTILCTMRTYSKIEYTESAKKCQEIAQKLNENKVFWAKTISSYEVKKILELYDIIPKTKEINK